LLDPESVCKLILQGTDIVNHPCQKRIAISSTYRPGLFLAKALMYSEKVKVSSSETDFQRRRYPMEISSYWSNSRENQEERKPEQIASPVNQNRSAWMTALSVLLLSTLDSFLTLHLMNHGAIEANPFMALVMTMGIPFFFVFKFALTGSCLACFLIFENAYFFHRSVRVKAILPAILCIYGIVIIYELHLIVLI
jgi:hypothetical protein